MIFVLQHRLIIPLGGSTVFKLLSGLMTECQNDDHGCQLITTDTNNTLGQIGLSLALGSSNIQTISFHWKTVIWKPIYKIRLSDGWEMRKLDQILLENSISTNWFIV